MNTLARTFIILGLGLTFFGILILIFSRLKVPFLGRLPGDIFIQKKNFTFYFPLATSLIVSVIISLVLYFVFHLHR